ncbi:MAG: hypothetical protein H3Z51_00730 [archaeon]|nr:hypothetical protein [archaeon]
MGSGPKTLVNTTVTTAVNRKRGTKATETLAKIHPHWQGFFMGHRGNIESVYTTRKHLSETLLQNMREAFMPSVEYLSTQPVPSSIEEQRKRDFLKNAELSGWFDERGLELIRQILKARD